ncbi:MAG: acireductone synthase [Acidobacteria bacterium]|nr:acireductone synthase [Acidobacteriota bacterium]
MAALLDPARIRSILLDIEGTTMPVDFVYGTLFPFARARVAEFLERHSQSDEVAADLEALKHGREAEAAQISGLPYWREDSRAARIESAAAYVRWLIDRDRKFTALKSLQGKIWEAGYLSGELRGQVYPDVALALQRWRRQGKTIAIFSSGSVLAQKLLFANSTAGDLTPFIGSYFDTTTGPKQEETSYRRIATALGSAPGEVLFLSDVIAELDAARRTGMQTLLCVRGGTPQAGAASQDVTHPLIRSFDEVLP